MVLVVMEFTCVTGNNDDDNDKVDADDGGDKEDDDGEASLRQYMSLMEIGDHLFVFCYRFSPMIVTYS